MKYQKAQGGPMPWIIGALVLVLIYTLVTIYGPLGTLKETSKIATGYYDPDQNCQLLAHKGSLSDGDGDGRPNVCDNCRCTKEDCRDIKTHNPDDDDDEDGFPKACDIDDSKETGGSVGMCQDEDRKDCSGTKCCKEDESCGIDGGTLVKGAYGFRCIIT